jgi:hypothetical protein
LAATSRFRNIIDGLSNTILFGEDYMMLPRDGQPLGSDWAE